MNSDDEYEDNRRKKKT